MKEFRWAIVATGNIANQYAQGIMQVKGARVEAVVSRTLAKAKEFGKKYGATRYYDSYDALIKAGEVDAVYIGTPHKDHFKASMTFLDAGMNVVCEKPLGVNLKEVETIIAKAKEKDVFFLEGMWTRFFPAIKQSLQWIKERKIGEPDMVSANFGVNNVDKSQWRFSLAECGGAMMDVGIYPLCMAFAVFGCDFVESYCAGRVENGVDIFSSSMFKYEGDRIAVINSAFTVILDNKVVISGPKGSITIGEGFNWWQAKKTELKLNGDSEVFCVGESEVFEDNYPSTGFQYEAKAVQEYILAGKKQADEFTWDESIKVAKTMQMLRHKMGVVFEADNK